MTKYIIFSYIYGTLCETLSPSCNFGAPPAKPDPQDPRQATGLPSNKSLGMPFDCPRPFLEKIQLGRCEEEEERWFCESRFTSQRLRVFARWTLSSEPYQKYEQIAMTPPKNRVLKKETSSDQLSALGSEKRRAVAWSASTGCNLTDAFLRAWNASVSALCRSGTHVGESTRCPFG